MGEVTFDPSHKYSSCFQKFNIVSIKLTEFIIHANPTLNRILLNRTISKNIVFKQKTKLIVKTISKHLQTFIYLFLFQQISENSKMRLKEITPLCMKKSLMEAGREKKENIS